MVLMFKRGSPYISGKLLHILSPACSKNHLRFGRDRTEDLSWANQTRYDFSLNHIFYLSSPPFTSINCILLLQAWSFLAVVYRFLAGQKFRP